MSHIAQIASQSDGQAEFGAFGFMARLVGACRRVFELLAPLGYEDEAGFHYGSNPQPPTYK
ncbi:MAG: hypothetical protein U1F65_02110 [Verrucomicrobiota bacterium]